MDFEQQWAHDNLTKKLRQPSMRNWTSIALGIMSIVVVLTAIILGNLWSRINQLEHSQDAEVTIDYQTQAKITLPDPHTIKGTLPEIIKAIIQVQTTPQPAEVTANATSTKK